MLEQLGAALEARVTIDWSVSDSKYIGAPFGALFSLTGLTGVSLARRPSTKALSEIYRTDHCDAYYHQRDSGWHNPQVHVDGRVTYTAGGGFSGPDAARHFTDFILSARKCNMTHVRTRSFLFC